MDRRTRSGAPGAGTSATRASVAFLLVVGVLTAIAGSQPNARATMTPEPGFVRGVYGGQPEGLGFNAASVRPYFRELDAASAKGFRAKIWLGDFKKCAFERGDDYVVDTVTRLKDSPAVLTYQLADEPYQCKDAAGRPRGPQMLAERSALVKSIDPDATTYVTLPSYQKGPGGFPYRPWVEAGAADIYGLVVYPVSNAHGYQPGKIRDAIKAADAVGMGRYWAVMQDFGNPSGWYARPTAAELAAQFEEWSHSRMEGYWIYEWSSELSGLEDHRDVLATQNAFDFETGENSTAPAEPDATGSGSVRCAGRAEIASSRLTTGAGNDLVKVVPGSAARKVSLHTGRGADRVRLDCNRWPNRRLTVTVVTGSGSDEIVIPASLPRRVKLTIRTGPGSDAVRVSATSGSRGTRGVVVSGGPGDDVIRGTAAGDRLSGGRGSDVLRGGAGPDRLRGGPGRDRLIGGAGSDRISSR